MARPDKPKATTTTTARTTLTPAGFFALRTPLLPFAELVTLGDGLTATAASPSLVADALAADRRLVQGRLRALVARPEVREALFIASPSLDESLPMWLDAPDSERGQKVERTLTRYLARMTTRPTPFGLFAGCSVGTLGATTQLTLGGRDGYRRHTRLDNDYLSTLIDALLEDSGVTRRRPLSTELEPLSRRRAPALRRGAARRPRARLQPRRRRPEPISRQHARARGGGRDVGRAGPRARRC